MIQTILKKSLWILLVLLTAMSHAAVAEWQIVPNESSITFTGIQNGAPASGSFKKFTGEIHLDPNQLSESKVRIEIDMNSVATSYSTFTSTLLTSDWFDVKKFPKAIFEATHFTKTANNTYQVSGTLTIRDKTLPITLTMDTESLSNTKGRVKGKVTIKRLDYNVGQGEWADTSLVKNEVEVNFSITATKKI